ncbi:hypothetical protein ABPG74_021091 [Tetrahymena malaccensis]
MKNNSNLNKKQIFLHQQPKALQTNKKYIDQQINKYLKIILIGSERNLDKNLLNHKIVIKINSVTQAFQTNKKQINKFTSKQNNQLLTNQQKNKQIIYLFTYHFNLIYKNFSHL